MEERTEQELKNIIDGVYYFKKELKKELNPLFIENFLHEFNTEELSSKYIELMALYFLKKFIENPEAIFKSYEKNLSYYLEEASEMEVLFKLVEAVKIDYSVLLETNKNGAVKND